MSTSHSPTFQSKTPAGTRLEGWWRTKRFDSGQTPDFDEMVQIVLNVVSPEDAAPLSCLTEALKAELSMFSASEEQWEKVAAGLKARLESLGTFLIQSDSEEGGVS